MKFASHDLDARVMVVAEIGNNHEGDIDRAHEMIRAAAQAGADAVKFQTFVPEHFVSASDTARIERLRRFRLSPEQFAALAATAKAENITFFSTPLDLFSAKALTPIVPFFKVASCDNDFMPLLEVIADTGKPIILSSGLATISDLQLAKGVIERRWRARDVNPGLAVLHCVSAYPVAPEQANLGAIRTMAAALDCIIGYSDHTLGIEACVLSVALGARIIEKHFTLDKAFSDFRDHQLSADPAEMRELIAAVRRAETLLGDGRKVLQPAEQEVLTALRRSIIATRDLAAGEVLNAADITWVRPGGGLPPGAEAQVLGRRLSRKVAAGTMLTADLFG